MPGRQEIQDQLYACLFEIRDLLKVLVGDKEDGTTGSQGKVQELDTGKRQGQGSKVEAKPKAVERKSPSTRTKKDLRSPNNSRNSKPLDGKVPNLNAPPKRKRVGVK